MSHIKGSHSTQRNKGHQCRWYQQVSNNYCIQSRGPLKQKITDLHFQESVITARCCWRMAFQNERPPAIISVMTALIPPLVAKMITHTRKQQFWSIIGTRCVHLKLCQILQETIEIPFCWVNTYERTFLSPPFSILYLKKECNLLTGTSTNPNPILWTKHSMSDARILPLRQCNRWPRGCFHSSINGRWCTWNQYSAFTDETFIVISAVPFLICSDCV